MSDEELAHEIRDGVVYGGYYDDGLLIGVGIQEVADFTLIVTPMSAQRTGTEASAASCSRLSQTNDTSSPNWNVS